MGEYAEDAIDQGIDNYLRDQYEDDWDEEFHGISSQLPPSDADMDQQRQQCRSKLPSIGHMLMLYVPDWLCYRKRWQPGIKIGILVSVTDKAILIKRRDKEHWLPLAYIKILKSE